MIAAILMSCCTGVAFAAENYVDQTPYTMTFQQENPDASYSAGDIVPVEIVLSENPGFSTIQFVLKFNKDLLQYMGPITFSDMFPESNFSNREVRLDPTAKAYGMFSTLAGLKNTALVAAGGRMVTVGFKVLDDTADASEYSITTTNTDRFSMGYVAENYDTTKYPNMTAVPCVVNVGASSGIDSVTLDKEKLTLLVGSTATLTATVLPEEAANKAVTWASDNEEVATVADGVVTAVAGGTANITVTTEDGGKTATCAVRVTTNTDPYTVTLQQKETGESYSVGDTILVQLILSENNPGGSGFTVRFKFDKNLLQYKGVVEFGNLGENYYLGSATNPDRVNAYGKATFGYMRTADKPVLTAIMAAGGNMFTAGFEVLDDSADPGDYTVDLYNTGDHSNYVYTYNTDANTYNDNVTIIPCTLNLGSSSTVAVESVSLDQQTLTLIEDETATLTATVSPEDATNKNVTWTSDNADVATVENGTVTAVAEGTANITVTTEDGEHTATCAVTVNAKQPEVKTGYTVSPPTDKTSIAAGESATVDVTVGVGTEETATTYNAVDMTITYDAEKLTFKKDGSALHEASVTDTNGTISLKRYGENLNVGTDKFSLVFTANGDANGDATVSITSAYVDLADKADQDAPAATIVNASHTISIDGGYKVTIITKPENLSEVSGAATAQKGADYTFTLEPLANYDYAVTATVNGAEVPCTLNGTTYTIPAESVTGDISITVTRTAKQYSVTLDGTGKDDATLSADKATYGTDYSFTVTQDADYNYTVSATAGGETLNLTSTNEGNVYTYTIAGDKITGDVAVTVAKEKKTTPPVPSTFDVTWDGNALDDVPTKADKATQGEDFSFTVTKQDGYTYEITATVGGEARDVNVDGDTYTISHINGAVVITVNKTAEATLTVEVSQYVKQNGKDVYLITATDSSLAEGKLLAYDGAQMFFSAKYDAYCYLVVSELSADEVKTDAEAKIAQADGSAIQIGYTGDVNQTGKIDINDAQMAHNMYGSALYDGFEKATIRMYLEADMNGDKAVDTADATAIVSEIK